ncbi:50S ribosomal protein L5 [Thermosipho africanus H17ap60334]|jgi:large subunit ribosomal protein L5|uniref:Large ribosomal subunit protein uL5 n=1 Tax=Thermosipho africanus (strain TCF52B) TaxID=484019 RepID=RL5_THEAB|nr:MULTISPECIES: 50S ribosomal protein L5 [Thermosipho]B7IHV8.1 RecName: Full=Large ribosomal subunit protein uL5; AltName: Full=50S ribosomal protein L5 [Thermosipho africanus TCF52B]HCF38477.1 50S ribosomal protein L5 [Thermosipho africanus]ACJ75672.1 50S ribosomal protein L5 [Thermosipho africanus TCF52B]EKF49695.1 50S ribosomal protein L5 [Thermosipho africanus H17ap60334]MBZ4650534.1 ribosomal protein [Thermosipho sp. (in: thermotogales)]MDK2899984.1 large subunit ribosomal protein [Ther
MQYIPLKEKYENEIKPAMMKEFGYKNIHQVPRLEKIVINMGIGEGSRNKDVIDIHAKELALIAGQKPVVTKAKKSISNFKIRKGMPIGLKVTLRGVNMYNFLYKLINLVLPKVRDFRGLNPNGFDGRGNYSFGLTEQLVFPEISPDQVRRVQGMDIVIVTTAKTDDEARKLLELFGFPFKR